MTSPAARMTAAVVVPLALVIAAGVAAVAWTRHTPNSQVVIQPADKPATVVPSPHITGPQPGQPGQPAQSPSGDPRPIHEPSDQPVPSMVQSPSP